VDNIIVVPGLAAETQPPVLIVQEAGRAPDSVWRLRRREESPAGNGTLIFSRPATSLVAIPTELSRFIGGKQESV
jgi:hypothetical protein